ncbi:Uncharacterised protein [Bordetella pertussis]|nr:Uncharacterised protein [Bordetella pertussis]CFP57747.1 Uncharacterised protein [Bordetella pertussis]
MNGTTDAAMTQVRSNATNPRSCSCASREKSGPMEVNRTISGTPWPAYHRVQYASRSSSGRVDNPSTLTQRARLAREGAQRTSHPS